MRVSRTGSSRLRADTASRLRRVAALALRPATPSDADAIADIFLAARKAAMPFLPDLHSDEETREWIRDVVLVRDEVWVAAAGERVDGFLAMNGDVLAHLYVAPRLHGGGVGSALFAKAKQLRPEGFKLWVFQRNTQARGFYEARGMRVVETTDGSGNEEQEPDAIYEWRPES
jgi:GNAT superfamily N-acetyltransferase